MTPEDRLVLARLACKRWRGDRDFDDLVSEAVIAGLGSDIPARVVRRGKLRAIDWMRRRDRLRIARAASVPRLMRERDAAEFHVGMCDPERGAVVVGDEREALIVERLLEGHDKQAVAAELGVHPSRVTQLLRQIRRRNDQLLDRRV